MKEATHKRGLVALSADPVTYGHLDLIRRAADKCRELVVLVANNDRKLGSYAFPLAERTAMVERAVADAGVPNVRVVGSSGLLVDVYLAEGCDRLFRGVRNEKDVDFEEEQAKLNCMILPSIEGRFEFIQSDPKLKLVSSTLVKAFVQLRLDVDKFVPMFVKQALEEKLLRQFRVTVTGGISVGKSWVAAELARQAGVRGIKAKHVNIDQCLREVYDEASNGAQDVRDALAERFGADVLAPGRAAVDRKALADRLFRKEADLQRRFVTELTMPHVARKYRDALAAAEGLVIVEWAQTAEMDMGPWTNDNVVVVDSDDRARFADRRGIPAERLALMDEIQWSADRKIQFLRRRCEKDKSGWVIRHQNVLHDGVEMAQADVNALLSKIVERMPGLAPVKP